MAVMRRSTGRTLLLLFLLVMTTACSSTTSAPIMSDAERCVLFGGFWMEGGWCRVDGQ
jgi:hypothetical protein